MTSILTICHHADFVHTTAIDGMQRCWKIKKTCIRYLQKYAHWFWQIKFQEENVFYVHENFMVFRWTNTFSHLSEKFQISSQIDSELFNVFKEGNWMLLVLKLLYIFIEDIRLLIDWESNATTFHKTQKKVLKL